MGKTEHFRANESELEVLAKQLNNFVLKLCYSTCALNKDIHLNLNRAFMNILGISIFPLVKKYTYMS